MRAFPAVMLLAALPVLLPACVTQEVSGASGIAGQSVCIVNNPSVWPEFAKDLAARIEVNGYPVSIVKTVQDVTCEHHLLFLAQRGGAGDGTYLSYLRLNVFTGAKLVGHAEYRARRGSAGNVPDFAETLGRLVNELLPAPR